MSPQFKRFMAAYAVDEYSLRASSDAVVGVPSDIVEILNRFGGCSFNRGVYRVIAVDQLPVWNQRILEGFPEYQGRAFCFSYDWLGRVFALDLVAAKDAAQILMFEPGSGDVLVIPLSPYDFHENELVEDPNAALASEFFLAWLESGGQQPTLEQCIGYKVPLFLGGEDSINNLEVSDVDVYWSVCSQLLLQTRDLPEGTKIGNISID